MPGPVLTSQLLLPFGNIWLPPEEKSHTVFTNVDPAHGYHIKAILNFTVTVMENRKTGRVPGRRKR